MSWLLGRRASAARHAPLPSAASQEDELDAAFGPGDSDDEDERDHRISISDAVAPSRSPTHARGPSFPSPGQAASAEPGDTSPTLPAYDSALSDIADRADNAGQQRAQGQSWRSRLSSAVHYGRLPTHDVEGTAGVAAGHRAGMMGSGTRNDGVFANLVAKPEAPRRTPGLEYVGGEDAGEKEVPPSYDIAAADSAPPYWETTVIAPQGYLGADNILVDGLPVGNLFAFAWNLLVSMSFQFVGFLLTYLLHTSHAAKNGSRAGLGITLIQWAFFMRQRAAQLQGELEGVEINDGASSEEAQERIKAWTALWNAPPGIDAADAAAASIEADALANATSAALQNATEGGTPTLQGHMPALQQVMHVSSVANTWLSYVLLALGAGLIAGALLNYFRAVKFAAAIRRGNNGDVASGSGNGLLSSMTSGAI